MDTDTSGSEVDLQAFLKSLANNNRIKILKHIQAKGRATATELVNKFYLEQPTVARHLAMLRKNGVITREITKPRSIGAKRGREVYYSLNIEAIEAVFEGFLNYVKKVHFFETAEDAKRQHLEHRIPQSQL